MKIQEAKATARKKVNLRPLFKCHTRKFHKETNIKKFEEKFSRENYDHWSEINRKSMRTSAIMSYFAPLLSQRI
jgi:hypothetical protein